MGLMFMYACYIVRVSCKRSLDNRACLQTFVLCLYMVQVTCARQRLADELATAQSQREQVKEQYAAALSALSAKAKNRHSKAVEQRLWKTPSFPFSPIERDISYLQVSA